MITTIVWSVLTLVCTGESLVVPPGFEDMPGPRSIGAAAPSEFRFQWRYPQKWFPNERITITEFNFRRNSQTRNEIVTFSDVLLRFSTRQERGLDRIFRNNLGDDTQQVYLGDIQQPLPVDGSPRPFDIVVPLANPFEYNPASGDLLVDFAVRGGVDIPPFWDGANASMGAVEYFSWEADEDAVGAEVTGRIPINQFVYYYSSTEDGDFNSDGILDAADVDQLSAVISERTNDKPFDLTGDDRVDNLDRQAWVESEKFANTFFGDANLDGEFNSSDLIAVFKVGEYEDGIAGNSGWADGDWNGDGEFDTSDFVIAFKGEGFERGRRQAVAVPEPSGMCSTVFVFIACWLRRRRRFSR
ncbi:MAG: hypothetical protein KDB27_22445 [Planctomycetales bacterium]|nr:hypothetical protein [Planctomycetales bacterium]